MRWAVIGVPALVLAGACVWGSAQAAAIKPGRWEFTNELRAGGSAPAPSATQLPPGAKPASGGMTATYTSCIGRAKAVPVEFGPQCKLDSTERKGESIAWSMICTNPQGAVRSDGIAQYHGDTMSGTMTSHLPGAPGAKAALTDMTQHITGRYLGSCLQSAGMPMTPSYPNGPPKADPKAPPNVPAGGVAGGAQPPAASAPTPSSTSTAAKPSASTGEKAAAAAPERQPSHPKRYVAHRRRFRYARSRRWTTSPGGGSWSGVSSPYSPGYGPAPYSTGGL
jgi:hypothetical protein